MKAKKLYLTLFVLMVAAISIAILAYVNREKDVEYYTHHQQEARALNAECRAKDMPVLDTSPNQSNFQKNCATAYWSLFWKDFDKATAHK